MQVLDTVKFSYQICKGTVDHRKQRASLSGSVNSRPAAFDPDADAIIFCARRRHRAQGVPQIRN